MMVPMKSSIPCRSLTSSWLVFVVVVLLVSLLTFCTLFSTKHSHIAVHHRLKRQIDSSNATVVVVINNSNDDDDDDHRQHNSKMLRQMLSQGISSSVLSDCTINMAIDGVYRLPAEDSLPAQVIRLIEQSFVDELAELRRIASKIRSKFQQRVNYFADSSIGQFRDEFSLDLRLLLASQVRIKEVDLIIASTENRDSFRIKYSRLNHSVIDIIDYDNVHEAVFHHQNILQTFTIANARDTLNDDQQQRVLFSTGWWLGPVLCEKNRNETSLMTHVFPLLNSYFLVTYFNISSVDINQCAKNDLPFGQTHKCPAGMQCYHQAGKGFVLGAYECMCKGPHGNTTITIDGQELEWNKTNENRPSESMTNTCECNPQLCPLTYNHFLRTVIVIIQSIFIVFVAILAAVVFQRRKLKIIKHSMWILLELILFGAALLYASVIIDSFGPHGMVCLIMPWLRELGFTVVYGILILRIYKMLAEFQSRKAHCVQVKEKDILRILFFMSISIIGYLLGWTFVNVDHTNENLSLDEYLLGHGFTLKNKRHFQTCRPRYWDYLVQCAEFIFLCVGIRFIYSTRTAPCEYHERKLITIGIVCEMLFSTLLHVIRDCLWASIDPDSLFILSFIRCHFTVTCMIIFIFCTKLCYIFRPFHEEYTGRDRFRSLAEGFEPADLVTKLQSNGDIEFGELSIRDMDPEEIRTELKRLYTSIHVLKMKTARKDNPHLSKKPGQRKKNRRFSMQTFQRHAGTHTNSGTAVTGTISHVIGSSTEKHEHELTKTPEDSTDEGEDVRGGTVSDITSPMSPTSTSQRVTFK